MDAIREDMEIVNVGCTEDRVRQSWTSQYGDTWKKKKKEEKERKKIKLGLFFGRVEVKQII